MIRKYIIQEKNSYLKKILVLIIALIIILLVSVLRIVKAKQVIVSSLIKEGYIEKITDINNNKCDSTKSYVKVVKNSKDTYTYSSYLVCPNYKVKK